MLDVGAHSARAYNPRKLWLRIRLACCNIETSARKRAKTTRIRQLIKNVDAYNKKGGRSRPKSKEVSGVADHARHFKNHARRVPTKRAAGTVLISHV